MHRPIPAAPSTAEWTPPDGLGYTRVRPVALTGQGIALLAVAVSVLLGAIAAGTALGIAAARDAKQHRLLRDQGASAEAVVTRLWRSRDDEKTPRVAYRFPFQERLWEGRATAPLRIWKRLAVGSKLPVRFLPSDPGRNRPEGWQDRPLSPWIPCLVAASTAALALLLTLPLRSQARLLAEGRPARGIVTAHRKTKDGTVVRYEFALLSGAHAKGKSGPLRHPPALGEGICVLYDPENPGKSASYPPSLVKLANRLASRRIKW